MTRRRWRGGRRACDGRWRTRRIPHWARRTRARHGRYSISHGRLLDHVHPASSSDRRDTPPAAPSRPESFAPAAARAPARVAAAAMTRPGCAGAEAAGGGPAPGSGGPGERPHGAHRRRRGGGREGGKRSWEAAPRWAPRWASRCASSKLGVLQAGCPEDGALARLLRLGLVRGPCVASRLRRLRAKRCARAWKPRLRESGER